MLDENVKAFVMYITFLSLKLMPISAQETQIALLIIKKMQIPSKYLDFLDVFLEKKALILLKATNLNQHAIKLQENQPCQWLYLAFKIIRWYFYFFCQKARR